MITFVVAIVALILGYVFYGAFVEKIFGVSTEPTPAYTKNDGVDFMPMPLWKVFLIQFLNIAGTGPIFGAIGGILFGPAAYLWIVLGCIFGGAVHDYLSGMVSLRKGGASLPEIVGDELGTGVRQAMRVFALLLMIMVGAVFVTTPAGLLESMTGASWGFAGTKTFWCIVIFAYYILATLLPINTLIGRIYPVFGVALLVMAAGVCFGIFTQNGSLPEITDAFSSHHPNKLPIFPFLFITIACGAISGFHATQSPMMARCLTNEKYGRIAFYGAMITEGFVALIWAAAAIKYADGNYETLQGLGNPAKVVNFICNNWMGSVGAILAILGVVAAPITSGDTALRTARLITADILHVNQDSVWRRLSVSLPIFACSAVLMLVDFAVLWRYFGWFNQTLSIFTFWAITVYLAKAGKHYIITLIPGLFMTAVCAAYFFASPECLALNYTLSCMLSIATSAVLLLIFIVWKKKQA